MAKKSMIARDAKRQKMIKQYSSKRKAREIPGVRKSSW